MSFGVCLFPQGGLSGNMEERPTCRVYIEILTCRAIFYHLEDSRSPENEREAERAQGARPPPLGARPGVSTNHVQSRGLCSTDLKDQGEPFNQCRFDPTTHVHLRELYKQTPWPLEEGNPHYSLAYFPERIQRERLLRVPTS